MTSDWTQLARFVVDADASLRRAVQGSDLVRVVALQGAIERQSKSVTAALDGLGLSSADFVAISRVRHRLVHGAAVTAGEALKAASLAQGAIRWCYTSDVHALWGHARTGRIPSPADFFHAFHSDTSLRSDAAADSDDPLARMRAAKAMAAIVLRGFLHLLHHLRRRAQYTIGVIRRRHFRVAAHERDFATRLRGWFVMHGTKPPRPLDQVSRFQHLRPAGVVAA